MHDVVPVGLALDELEELRDPDHRPRVAGKQDEVELAEDRVDRAARQSELAKVAAGQERLRAS